MNNLTGSLPSSLNGLWLLQYLRLEHNPKLVGTMESSIYSLERLLEIGMSLTSISGSLSDRLSQLSRLQKLELMMAHLSGTMPRTEALEHLTSLEKLGMEFPGQAHLPGLERGSSMSGTIPTSLCAQTSRLNLLVINHTTLSGTIPSCMPQSLSEFQFDWTRISGTLGVGLSNVTTLKKWGQFSARVSGTLSREWMASTPAPLIFRADFNKLSGTLPFDEWGHVPNGSEVLQCTDWDVVNAGYKYCTNWLSAGWNRLSGTLGDISKLTKIWFLSVVSTVAAAVCC